MGDEFRIHGFSLEQHSQNPVTRGSRRKVLERVSADHLAHRIDLSVEGFEDFGQGVENEHNQKIPASRIFRPYDWRNQQYKHRINLHGSVPPQISLAAPFAVKPLQDAPS